MDLFELEQKGGGGDVTKYGTEGGGRYWTGSPKLLVGSYWANELFQVINVGHEGICVQYFYNYFKHFQRHFLLLA